jgi:serine O-acetyltransferase
LTKPSLENQIIHQLTANSWRTKGSFMNFYSICRYVMRFCRAFILLPHLSLFRNSASRDVIAHDVRRWVECTKFAVGASLENQLRCLLLNCPEFRNLFYHRIGHGHRVANWVTFEVAQRILKPLSTLYLSTNLIGPGLFILHGFSTIISARSIGRDCTVFQQVTIGHTNATDFPTIGNEVTVYAGAMVLGNVTLGDGCTVGAGAVVVDDVPVGVTVVGPKARPTRPFH